MGLLDSYLPRAGEILAGRYRLEEEIGRGAFGVVFRAVHEALDSNVAVKVLRPRVVDEPHVRKRFEREIAVAKSLQHPNSIRILDVDATLKGLPFYVMEYVDGRTLREVINDDGPLDGARVIRITDQILKSLAEAHARGIVHRDLKPGNIMLFDLPGESDVVKVLDFGIAKALGTNESFETAVGTVLGTPYYMSPEQASGAAELDGRSDLYSLGIIAADCLGFPPEYEADTAMEHLAAQLMPDPLPFPARIESCSFWPLIEKATEKIPSRRFANAVEMRDALATATTPTGPSEAPPPPTRQAHRSSAQSTTIDEKVSVSLLLPESRSKLYVAAGIAALLAVIIFVILPVFTAPAAESSLAPVPAQTKEDAGGSGHASTATEPDRTDDAGRGAEPAEPVQPTGPVVAIARISVGAALVGSTDLAFEGVQGTEIVVGGRTIGVLPFSTPVPALSSEFEFVATRRGYSRRALGRLNASVIDVVDPVPRDSPRSGSGRSEPIEPAEEAPPTPFGTAPIHD